MTDVQRAGLRRFIIVVLFSIAFAYIESAVVVYLRAIFYPNGFHFPLEVFGAEPIWRRFLLTEIGREAATIVLIFTGSYLAGRNRQQRAACFLTIFAVWDIFYYIWLKVLIDWPGSIMDWDVLFLIPAVWASPVLAPVLVSLVMLAFACAVLYMDSSNRIVKVSWFEGLGLFSASLLIIISFCIAGLYISEPDFESYFSWLMYLGGLVSAILFFIRSLARTEFVSQTDMQEKGIPIISNG